MNIIIKTTNACDMDCKYCFDKKEREIETQFMKIETFYEIIEKCPDNINIVLHGGESKLLGLDWIKKAVKKCKKKNISISLQTNAKNINNIKDELLSLGINIGTSYDFYNDNLNRGKIEKKDLEFLIENKSNIEVIDFYKIDYKKLYELRKKFNSNSNFIHFNNKETDEYIKTFCDNFFNYFKLAFFNEKIVDSILEDMISLILKNKNLKCKFSGCLSTMLSVDLNGNFHFCDVYGLRDVERSICNITEIEKIQEVFNKNKYIDKVKVMLDYKDKNCYNCKIKGLCKNTCMFEVLKTENLNKTTSCKINEILIEKIYNFFLNLKKEEILKISKKKYQSFMNCKFPFNFLKEEENV